MTDGESLNVPPESQTRIKLHGNHRGQDLQQLELLAAELRIRLTATQITAGVPEVEVGLARIGAANIASYCANQAIALSWHPTPNSLNFALQLGVSAGVQLEGSPRKENSVLIYSAPSEGHWVGVLPQSQPDERVQALHLSLPLSHLEALALPAAFNDRGWAEVQVNERALQAFLEWSEKRIQNPSAIHEMDEQTLVESMKELLAPWDTSIELALPSHYSHIVGLVEAMLDQSPVPGTLTVGDIASHLSISVRTLQRAFRAMFNVGISRYLQHRRLKKARELILVGSEPISSVAHSAGFRHTSRFAQQYRRLYGFSPSETSRATA